MIAALAAMQRAQRPSFVSISCRSHAEKLCRQVSVNMDGIVEIDELDDQGRCRSCFTHVTGLSSRTAVIR
jgi:hypothetical protein